MEELYKVLYDYDAQRNDELSLKVGDIVHIIQYDSEEWCVAENMETKQEGAVPTNFLEKLNSGQNNTTIDNGPILAKVLQDYTAQDPEELSLWKNGIITILDQSIADGWWKGDLNGKTGIFPSNHVKLIDAHEQSMDVDENDKNKRQSFKLAAYGVKQGGIGSILAGGFNLRKKTSKKDAVPQEEIPSSSLNQQHQIPTLSDNSSQEEADKQSPDIREKAMVISSYDPQNHDELQLVPGGYITIVDKLDDQGWWKGLNEKNEEGVFPSNFVQILPQEGTPVRPARARPPTIKTDSPNTQPQPSVTSPTGLAKPPAVPTGTRPSSLLTRRPPTTSTAEQSAPPLPRPTTSPPVPSRRTNSVIKEQHPPASHKRTPSIPLVSPDLPPIRQDYAHDQHPVRPSRPVPSPSSAASNMTTPISPTSEDKTFGLAKPPKVNILIVELWQAASRTYGTTSNISTKQSSIISSHSRYNIIARFS
ncbi:SH3 domain-containing protein [Halteromyces radiatus]|uniref:SH3 domain-containing protein n=1 Tax=Halteromyces radiatus TaxID=101107 RepID=UPI00221FE555|nr:SH3 domain-containing protein [Halteromyces radiatus]KAI8093275.1 SH3 domain-containing protein [Halteromyces radiatus]